MVEGVLLHGAPCGEPVIAHLIPACGSRPGVYAHCYLAGVCHHTCLISWPARLRLVHLMHKAPRMVRGRRAEPHLPGHRELFHRPRPQPAAARLQIGLLSACWTALCLCRHQEISDGSSCHPCHMSTAGYQDSRSAVLAHATAAVSRQGQRRERGRVILPSKSRAASSAGCGMDPRNMARFGGSAGRAANDSFLQDGQPGTDSKGRRHAGSCAKAPSRSGRPPSWTRAARRHHGRCRALWHWAPCGPPPRAGACTPAPCWPSGACVTWPRRLS